MSPPSPLGDVFTRLVRVQTELWNAVDHRVRAEHGVALTDLTTLHVVTAVPGCRVQDLANTLHITVGGASKVVDRLVQAGLVIRDANPDDRRSSVLLPTEAGRELVATTEPEIEKVLEERLGSRLTASDLTSLASILRKLQGARHITASPQEGG